MWIIQINDFIPSIPAYCVYNCLMILGPHTDGKIKETGWWRQNLQNWVSNNKGEINKFVCMCWLAYWPWYCVCVCMFIYDHTFSGNQGVTNGIWNVLLYECRVSNESGETAPIIAKTPRENWLQTERELKKIMTCLNFDREKYN